MLSSLTSIRDPLAVALARKAKSGVSGAAEATPIAEGDGWRVLDVVCTSGPGDRPFEERFATTSISLVLSGAFVYRTDRGTSLLSSGALMLGNAGHSYECSHQHDEGDRCLSFQFDPEFFERVAYDAGVPRGTFERHCLPPLRELAPLTARARTALETRFGIKAPLEEIALELCAKTLRSEARVSPEVPTTATSDRGRIVKVLRQLESQSFEPLTLPDLARTAGLSRFHFLRTFKRVTGVTPHQWILRARLREAAQRLAVSKEPVTEIAFDVGFEDLSNFIRTFRAEFGVSPSRYRSIGLPLSQLTEFRP